MKIEIFLFCSFFILIFSNPVKDGGAGFNVGSTTSDATTVCPYLICNSQGKMYALPTVSNGITWSSVSFQSTCSNTGGGLDFTDQCRKLGWECNSIFLLKCITSSCSGQITWSPINCYSE